MRELTTRVLIVGGGPAGVSTGLHLLNNSVDCLIVDKAHFPREKLCGGLITEKGMDVLRELDIDLSQGLFYRPEVVRFFDGSEKIFEYKSKADYAVVDRLQFDDLMMRTYEQRGGRSLQGERVIAVNREEGYATTSADTRIYYQILVGADGANSIIRRTINHKRIEMAFCTEIHEPKNKIQHYPADGINVIFSKVAVGFAWVFEGVEGSSVGAGGISEDRQEILGAQESMQSGGNVRGAFVPYGQIPQVRCDEDVFLIGDAGAYVDPILGEGIAYALMSGKAMAAVVCSHRRDHIYRKGFSGMRKSIHYGRWYQKLFFNKYLNPLAIKALKKHPNLTTRLCEHLVMKGDVQYHELKRIAGLILKR